MPAMRAIFATLNDLAQARLPAAAGWRAAGFEASRSFLTGRPAAPVSPEWPDKPESAYARAGAEPLLDEVLGDPVVQLIMRADHVQPAELRRVLAAAPPDLARVPPRQAASAP